MAPPFSKGHRLVLRQASNTSTAAAGVLLEDRLQLGSGGRGHGLVQDGGGLLQLGLRETSVVLQVVGLQGGLGWVGGEMR